MLPGGTRSVPTSVLRMGAVLLHVVLALAAGFLPGLCEDSIKVRLVVEPPGSTVIAGEPVSLRCALDAPSSLGWTYSWSQPIDPGHQTAGDRYNITAVTAADRGPYWCAVRRNGTDERLWRSNNVTLRVSDSWSWVVVLCCIAALLLLAPVSGILVYRCRSRSDTSARGCFRQFRPGQQTPQTKPDVTEVQWDVPWLEMTNLLERQDQPAAP